MAVQACFSMLLNLFLKVLLYRDLDLIDGVVPAVRHCDNGRGCVILKADFPFIKKLPRAEVLEIKLEVGVLNIK